MRLVTVLRFSVLVLSVTFTLFASESRAQKPALINGPIDENARVSLPGNVHPLAQARFDRGAVPDSIPVGRVLLLLKRPPAKQAALEQFLQAAHTAGDPGYHHWLTPAQFGKTYGPADSDVTAVSGWLQTHGLKVARVTAGQTAIEFSGSAGQLREAFRTQIHMYEVDGEVHRAIDRDPEIPAALAAVIAGLTPLNDFRPRSHAKVLGQAQYDVKTHAVTPEWTINSNLALALAPGDFAMQYDLNPLYQSGTNGTGVTIGIIGASNVDPTVVANYRALFGLTASPVNVIVDGTDPGQNGAAVESYLDVEVAGSVAPAATIDLYTAADTTVQSGLFLAAQRAVDEDAAAVLGVSYGVCEQQLGAAGNQFFAALWEQAAAQGQTVLVSSGDGGSAGCDNFDLPDAAQYGLAVNGFGSTPWNVSVGGTDFYYTSYSKDPGSQQTELATYWNLTPSGLPSVSLLRPIPEQPWNRAFGLNLFDNGIYNPNNLVTIVAGSGGKSSCTSGTSATDGTIAACSVGYAKPAWQTGFGVPMDGARDLPDVSLFAAPGENDSFYPICAWTGDCVPVSGSVSIGGVGGTSASTPAMAGIMALVNQRFGRQGQANFVLYPMSAQYPRVFHDVTIGSNVVPCQQGTPDCTVSALPDNTDGIYTLGHYYAGTGYDQAIGLGSVDANLLVKNWNALHFASSATTLMLSETTFPHGTPINASVGVTGSGGTPSGDVVLTTAATPAVNTGLATMTLANGSAAKTLNNLPGGQYQVTARYGGDGTFASSSSAPVTVNVTPEASALNLSGLYWVCNQCTAGTFLPVVNGASYPYGTYIVADAQPRSANAAAGAASGVPTGSVTFSDGATSYAVNPATINVTRAGVAEWSVAPGFQVATHVLSAAYSGDASFQASKSASSISFTITQGATQMIVPGQPTHFALGTSMPIHLQLGIYPSVVVAPPSGQVAFSLGSQVLGTAPVTSIYGYSWFGEATFNAKGLPLGQNLVTIQYPGDNNYTAASGSITIWVLQPAGLFASVSPNPVNQAGTAVVTATVTGVKGVPPPTGYVFMGTPNYSCGTAPALTATSQSTSCSFDAVLLDLGTDIVTVAYSGDTNYAPQSVAVLVTVTVPFSLTATPVHIAAGATTGNTSTVTVTPQGGFTGTALLSCMLTASPSGAQSLPDCGINSVNLTGTNAVTTTMTVYSTAPGNAAALKADARRKSGLGAGAGAMLACVVLFGIWRRRRRWMSYLAVALLAASGILQGCGGHSANTTGGTQATGTTPGTYTFTVTGSFPGILPWSQLQTTTVQVTIQ